MGSICHVYKRNHWEIIEEGNLYTTQEEIYNIEIGEWNEYGSSGKLKIWTLKEVYNKVLNGEYIVISQAYSDTPILIRDKNENEINLLLKRRINK